MTFDWLIKTLKKRRAAVAAFRRDDSGSMIIFSMFILVLMLMIGGLAVDLMRLETTRTKLQGTMDRAVLAAADLDQTLPPADVVKDYFTKAGMINFLQGEPTVTQGLNYRTVTASAEARIPMLFSNLMSVFDGSDNSGLDSVAIPTSAGATEMVGKVEISLVLDVSGSMDDNNKMVNLRQAANDFVDAVLTTDNQDRVSVSIVPYSEQVNLGTTLYNKIKTTTRHTYSFCVEVPDSHYSSAALNTSYRFLQMQHFQWNYYYNGDNSRNKTVCPRYSQYEITPWSQNRTDLHSQINALEGQAGTAIYLGMKWGTALLDPSMRSINTSLIGSGKVDSAFAGRPADYSDVETLKTVILMTDGENSSTSRITDVNYNSSSEYKRYNSYNFWYYLVYYVNSYYWSSYYYYKYTPAEGDALLSNICDAAKAEGIVVWTIGFETNTHGSQVMEDCASSPTHFFDVDGVEISDAFSAIARQINNLKLMN